MGENGSTCTSRYLPFGPHHTVAVQVCTCHLVRSIIQQIITSHHHVTMNGRARATGLESCTRSTCSSLRSMICDGQTSKRSGIARGVPHKQRAVSRLSSQRRSSATRKKEVAGSRHPDLAWPRPWACPPVDPHDGLLQD